jgi:pyridoxine/pyridoxamine 5'-phosphate oxidase
VLLKAFDQRDLVFFTNTASRKAVMIAENNRVSLLFP